MNAFFTCFTTEARLFLRNIMGFFFTFLFPPLAIILFGAMFGNEPTPYFGGLGSMDVSVPGYAGMIMAVTGLMCLPLTLAEYKDQGIYKRFDATPAGKGIVLASQLVVNFVMTALGIAVLLATGYILYQIRITGTPPMIVASLLLGTASTFALGFFIAAASPNQKIANLLSFTLYFLMLFLSGATMPMEMMSETINKISLLLPLTHVVKMLTSTFAGKPINEYSCHLLIVAGCLIVFGAAGALLYKRKRWS